MLSNTEPQSKEDELADIIETANHLSEKFGSSIRIRHISECNDEYFLVLHETLLGESLPGTIKMAKKRQDRIRNCQLVIDSLAKDILGIDLSHIFSHEIVDGDVITIRNLLEIYVGLLEYITEELQQENDQIATDNIQGYEAESDADVLPEDHDILSDVIQEEFGASYSSLVDQQKQLLPMSNKETSYKKPLQPSTSMPKRSQVSVLDFTDDSLNVVTHQQPKRTTGSRISLSQSSSASSSTDDLLKEAERYQRSLDSKRLSSSNHPAKPSSLPEQASKSAVSSRMIRDAEETLLTKTSMRSSQIRPGDFVYIGDEKQPSRRSQDKTLPRSTSSTIRPSTLVTHDLHSPSQTKENGSVFANIDVQARGPLPGESVETASEPKKPPLSSVTHTHHHYHYHHRLAPKATSTEKGSSNKETVQESQKKTGSTSRSRLFRKEIPSKEDSMAYETSTITRKRLDSAAMPISLGHSNTETTQIATEKQPSQKNRLTTIIDRPFETPRVQEKEKDSQVEPVLAPAMSSRAVQTSVSSVTMGNEDENQQDEIKHEPGKLTELEQRLRDVRATVKSITYPSDEPGELFLSHDEIGRAGLSMKKETRIKSKRSLPTSFELSKKLGRHRYDSAYSDSEVDYETVGRFDTSVRRTWEPGASCLKSARPRLVSSETSEESDEYLEIVPKHRPRRKVKFEDEESGRDQRLERLIKILKDEEKENTKDVRQVRHRYREHLKTYRDEQEEKLENERKKSRYRLKEERRKKPTVRPASKSQTGSRLARIYGGTSRSRQRGVSKPRKRSASSSPVKRARRRGRLILREDDILPVMEEEFPFLHLSPVTAKLMWQKQMRQISNLCSAGATSNQTKTQKQIEEAEKKQEALIKIMKKELDHNKRLREQKEKAQEERQVKSKLRERRLASARARRYYDDYQLRMRARMLKRRTKEEKIFKNLFEDALEIQKQRVRELRNYAKEQREVHAKRQKNDLQSLENYYRDQFSMLAENLAKERYELEVRQKAQAKTIEKMRTGIRERMNRDIQNLQEELARDEDTAYFRQLDADTLKKEFQLATYKIGP